MKRVRLTVGLPLLAITFYFLRPFMVDCSDSALHPRALWRINADARNVLMPGASKATVIVWLAQHGFTNGDPGVKFSDYTATHLTEPVKWLHDRAGNFSATKNLYRRFIHLLVRERNNSCSTKRQR